MFGQGFVSVALDMIGVIPMGAQGMCIVQFVKKRGILTHTKNAPQKI